MARPEKEAAVEEIAEKLERAKTLVFTDFIGLDVEQMTELRAKLREAGVEYKVVKNTLAKIAARQQGLDEITDELRGPTAIAFGIEDVVSPARILVDFAKEHDLLEIKSGFLNGDIIDAGKVESLANIPAKEVLLSQVFAGMQAPISGLVNTLQGNIRNLVQVLSQVKEKKDE
ncbi:MAG: 50S ribosomal protein L10 [Halanaerobiaceae bacterium]